MKNNHYHIKRIVFLFIVVFIFGYKGYAQHSKGKDEILSYIPNEDKEEVDFGWKAPTKKAIITLLRRLPEISTQEWNMCYGTFQSNVKGYLRYKNHIYKYEVNAGGWIYLSSKEKTKILGSKDKKDTISNFISVYYCDEMK